MGKKVKKKPKKKPKNPEPLKPREVDEREAIDFQTQITVLEHLIEAMQSGHFMVAIWHLNGGDIKVWIKLADFMCDDFDQSLEMLRKKLRENQQEIEALSPPLPGSEGAQPQDPG